MSSTPTGTSRPSISRIFAPSRCASGTPRVWMPTRPIPPDPLFLSRISCAILESDRSILSASRICTGPFDVSPRSLISRVSRTKEKPAAGCTAGAGWSSSCTVLSSLSDSFQGRAHYSDPPPQSKEKMKDAVLSSASTSMPSDVVGRVLENQQLGGGYFLTTFDAPPIAGSCQPGQFVMAGSRDPAELLLRRPFSVCLVGRGPGGDRSSLSLLYRVVGLGTGFL